MSAATLQWQRDYDTDNSDPNDVEPCESTPNWDDGLTQEQADAALADQADFMLEGLIAEQIAVDISEKPFWRLVTESSPAVGRVVVFIHADGSRQIGNRTADCVDWNFRNEPDARVVAWFPLPIFDEQFREDKRD